MVETPVAFALEPLPEITLDQVLLTFEGLTFPPIERRLELRPLEGPLVGAVVRATAGVAGLALAEVRRGAPSQVVSLLVRPEVRRRGIGRLLLAETERRLLAAGAREVEGAFRTSWRSREAIERLLAGAGWSSPETRLLTGRGGSAPSGELALRLLTGGGHPPEAELFAWADLSAEERTAILESKELRGGFPERLDPFQEEARLEPAISVGVRWQGEVAGWLIVHRVGFDTVQYTSLWVRPDLRRLGIARSLLGEAIRRRLADPVLRHGTFVVDPRNGPMRAFVERHLAPGLLHWSELRVSRKPLVGAGDPGSSTAPPPGVRTGCRD